MGYRSGFRRRLPLFTIVAAVLLGAAVAAMDLPPGMSHGLGTPGQSQAAQGQAAQSQSAPRVQPDPQMPPVRFKVEVNYVEVDAIVVDQQGRFVSDLKAEDFRITEDKKPQTISTFGVVQVPVEYAEAPLFVRQPIEPDVRTNIKPFDGRLYVLVLDNLHTDVRYSPRVRAAAKRFVETQLGANDMVAVVTTGGDASAAQDFTANRRLLVEAIDKFMGRSLRPATLARIEDYQRYLRLQASRMTSSQGPKDLDEGERAYYARSTLDTIRRLSDILVGVRGRRKAVVLFSQGIDYDITDVFNNPSANDVRYDTQDAIAAATRANVSIYSVDPRGLTDMAGDSMELQPVTEDPSLQLDVRGLQNELRIQHDSLRVLSDETGGFAALNSNDFASAFNRIRDENSTYYVLGYYPTNDRRDGRFRKIDVRVTRPGLQVRARKGYAAPRGSSRKPEPTTGAEAPPPLLREALDSPLPVSGVRMSVFAAPFRGAPPNASVAVVLHADGRSLNFVQNGDRFEGRLNVSVIAVDSGGKIRGALHQRVDMPLKPESRPIVEEKGLRTLLRIDVPPGRYQVRVAALDARTETTGSVYYDLDVPDFEANRLTMSGVVLTASVSGNSPVAGMAPDDELRKVLPGPPVTTRVFQAGEELALWAEVYDNEAKTPHKVDIATTLRSDDGREVFRIADERSSDEIQGARGGYGYTARVPLEGVPPGLYVLKVEARSRLGKGQTTSREIQIRVVAAGR